MGKELLINHTQESLPNSSPATNGELQLGEWKLSLSNTAHVFTKENVEDGLQAIKDWETAFPLENTWTRTNHNIPSLFLRLDATIYQNRLAIYEIEERPSGVGITSHINPQFREHLKQMKETWPEFGVIISNDPSRRGSDDLLWLPPGDPNSLVLVRAEPHEEEFHHLEEKSVSSLKMKGDKSYGESMGMWRDITHTDQLDFDEAFVIKPKSGSKTRDIFIYVPTNSDAHPNISGNGKTPGTYKRNRVERVVQEAAEKGGVYRQDFYPPIESKISENPSWMIYRVFYGYNLQTNEWECMGGSWNARPNLKIHGSSDSLYGPIPVER